MLYLYAWNKGSVTAKNLSERMGIRRIKHTKSKFKGRKKKVVINYGSSELPEEVQKCTVIQSTDAIALNSHKLRFFRHMSQGDDCPRLPPWTEDQEQVRGWMIDGHHVMARTRLQAHSGEGIVIMSINNPEAYVPAPLYTRYVKKKDEYRLHFVGDQLIDYARKALRKQEGAEYNEEFFMVRNHSKGFVYAREGVNLPKDVVNQATKAMRKSGLDYGAVDVIYNVKHDKAYVLEINTAPGMEGSTLDNYANALKLYVEGKRQ